MDSLSESLEESASEERCDRDASFVGGDQIDVKFCEKETSGSESFVAMRKSDDEAITPVVRMRRKGTISTKRKKRKLKEIEAALSADPSDLDALRRLAISEGGLLKDEVRQKVWPKLLSIDPYEVSPKPPLSQVEGYEEFVQVTLDVQRCLRRFPPGIPVERRLALQDQLTHLIVRVLLKHPHLYYYQGYHDICVTFLLVVGEELAFALVEKLSTTASLSLYMEKTMESTVRILDYVNPIVGKRSPSLYGHMRKAELSTTFCLSWVITLFGHVVNDYHDIVRLYDFFLATHSLMPIYLAAAVILHREDQIMLLEPDMALLHQFLSNIPDDLPFEKIIQDAISIFSEYPPDVLKKDAEKLSSMEQGFGHKWISSSARNRSLPVLLLKQSIKLWHYAFPADGRRRRLLRAAGVLLPVFIAIFVYNYSLKSYNNHL